VTDLEILIAVLAVPYVGLNVRRLLRGRSWAFTFCQVAREWEEREHAYRLAARAGDRARTGETAAVPPADRPPKHARQDLFIVRARKA
jgi:hypothetical protein